MDRRSLDVALTLKNSKRQRTFPLLSHSAGNIDIKDIRNKNNIDKEKSCPNLPLGQSQGAC